MSARTGARWWIVLGVAAATAVVGFVLGARWPFETVTGAFGSDRDEGSSWSPYVRTDLPRYENLSIARGDSLFLLGGFIALDPQGNALATDHVEILDLRTGEFEDKAPLPMGLTHAGGALVGDSIWVVGGFVGDHPGPVTDEVWVYSIPDDAWSPGPSLPLGRGGGQLVLLGDTLHYFGGWLPDRNTGSTDHWQLVIGDSAWTPVAEFPIPRGHFTHLRVDGGFYAIGGNIGHDPLPVDVPAVHWFHPDAGQWVRGPDLPFAVSHTEPATVPYEGGAVMVGGRSRTSGRENLDDVLYFDVESQRWVHLGRLSVPFLGGTAGIVGDTLVTGMGAEVGNDPRNAQLWKRPLRNRWLPLDSLPHAVSSAGAAVVDGIVYAVGQGTRHTMAYDVAAGQWLADDVVDTRPWGGGGARVEVFDGRILVVGARFRGAGQAQAFDPGIDEWRLDALLPEPVSDVATAVLEGRLYAMGGMVEDGTVAGVYSIGPGESSWTAHPPLPRPRSHAAAGSDGSRVFVFGGRDDSGAPSNDLQVYDPAIGAWEVEPARASMPEARASQGRAVFVDGEFWLIGGEGPSGVSRRVDVFDPVAGSWRAGPELTVGRAGAAPVLDGGRILLAGGRSPSGEAMARFEYIWPRRR